MTTRKTRLKQVSVNNNTKKLIDITAAYTSKEKKEVLEKAIYEYVKKHHPNLMDFKNNE